MWEQIQSNRVKSVIYVILMGLLMVFVGWIIGVAFESPIAGLVVAFIVWGIMSFVAYFEGDSIMLSVAGARKIEPKDNPRLYNIVEEMKIASGLPKMPDVYIIDDPAMNAFATGRDEYHSSVAITSGLLQKLNRDELQGVIGHEMSHIKNQDVRLMSLLGVMMGTIVILAYYASRFMFYGGMSSGRRSSKDGGAGAQIILLAIGLILMILAPLFAQLIYFAVSRRREYLADASSALYTRYPEGLASALEKLSTNNVLVSNANKATAPMYIADPYMKKANLNDLTATHPPLAERIKILRRMGGASPAEYERAYEEVKGKGGAIPASALKGDAVRLRAASPEAPQEIPDTKVARTRDTGDMLARMGGYTTIDCPCGTRLKAPPSFKGSNITCPHCGRVHRVG